MDKEILIKIYNDIKEETKKKYISFIPERKKTSIFNSKLGGIPYMPKEFEYPKKDNKALAFLGQINFDEQPNLKMFPQKGILQFFISDNEDELWGASAYKKYEVIYHENIDYSSKESEIICGYPNNFPVHCEYLLKGKISYDSITVNDYKFNEIFMNILRKYIDVNVDGYWEIPGINEDDINRIFSSDDIKCGGSPCFIQGDIREYKEDLKNSVLLFEIPSILNNDIKISWGDSGIANFFINEEDLIEKNFSNVSFSWDCY